MTMVLAGAGDFLPSKPRSCPRCWSPPPLGFHHFLPQLQGLLDGEQPREILAAGVQKPLLLWAIHAANQHGAVGRTEGAAAWQAGGGHRGAQSRAMHGLTHTSCKKCDYDPPHKHTWGQIPS